MQLTPAPGLPLKGSVSPCIACIAAAGYRDEHRLHLSTGVVNSSGSDIFVFTFPS